VASRRLVSRAPAARTTGLAFAALGIVYGDIGTSPLYALRESFEGAGHVLPVSEDNVLGLLSLVFWSLIVVVAVKYLGVVMRADNDGEGGILALTALVRPHNESRRGARWVLVIVGLFGTALLYGDGMITPAISVLSAVEGTEVVTDRLDAVVVPIAVGILIGLFAVQRRGTGSVARMFGPIMVVWFAVLASLGSAEIIQEPAVLRAVNPIEGAQFFADNGATGFLALGSVFLVVTGGEALYADMGHFGRLPIAVGWYGIVLPALVLNYFGQGALLLTDPTAIDNPFYRLAPSGMQLPLVVLATAATVIASQALISGAFSLTRQAIQLGYLPRLKITHTSATQRGQVYVRSVNWALMIACVGLVVGFRSSTNLAAAYGVAVTMTMAITTIIFFAVAVHHLHWPPLRAAAVCAAFFVVDLAFFGANLPKVPHGGWFPLIAGGGIFTLLTTWRTGRRLVGHRLRDIVVPLEELVARIEADPPTRLPGTAVYLFSLPGRTPPALQTNLRINHALHERIIVASVSTADTPTVQPENRLEHATIGAGIEVAQLRYGFMETPDIPTALRHELHVEGVAYLVGSEAIVVTAKPGMARWREHLYALMHRNATPAWTYFRLPDDDTIGISTQIEL
jgi:KUP system potassium uptake protein